MNIKNNQFWFWGFIVLAALLISAITTMGIKTYRFHNANSDSSYVRACDKGQKGKHGKRGMRNRFNFSKDQRQFFIEERKLHQQKLITIKNKRKDSHNKLFKEISKNKPDYDSIEIYKKEILESNEEIIDETIKHYEILKTRLSQDQMQMVKDQVSKRFRRHKRQ